MPNNNLKQEIINFYGDNVIAVKDDAGEIWAIMIGILRNIGFDEYKISNQRKAWSKDVVISKGSKILPIVTSQGIQKISCINRRYIPLALAKIAITPTMQREQPVLVEKLIRYQEECADALYKHFYKNALTTTDTSTDTATPLTREEMAMYWTNLMATAKDYTQILNRRDESRDRLLDGLAQNQSRYYSKMIEQNKALVELITSLKDYIIASNSNTIPAPIVTPTLPEIKAEAKPTATTTPTVNTTINNFGWISKANEDIISLRNRSGKSAISQSREIYSIMRRNGCNFKSIPGIHTVTIISDDKDLRIGFENAIEELRKKYYPEEYKAAIHPMSAVVRKVPENISEAIKKYAKKNKISYGWACSEIYKSIESSAGVSLNKMCSEYSRKIGVANCNRAYMISHNADLMKVFNTIIKGA